MEKMSQLRAIPLNELVLDPARLYRDAWGLLTAGTREGFNSMTVSWGCFGELWGKPVTQVFVRNSRYTYEFMDKSEYFTVCFFEKKMRPQLLTLGSRSGRDMDKMNASGFTPVFFSHGIAYEEAVLCLVCRKLYAHNFSEGNFYDKEVFQEIYGEGGFHREFIAEVEKAYVRA